MAKPMFNDYVVEVWHAGVMWECKPLECIDDGGLRCELEMLQTQYPGSHIKLFSATIDIQGGTMVARKGKEL